jgi:hypothetical protein
MLRFKIVEVYQNLSDYDQWNDPKIRPTWVKRKLDRLPWPNRGYPKTDYDVFEDEPDVGAMVVIENLDIDRKSVV